MAGPDTPEWLPRQAGQSVVVALAYVKLDNLTSLESSATTSLRGGNTGGGGRGELSHNFVDYLNVKTFIQSYSLFQLNCDGPLLQTTASAGFTELRQSVKRCGDN